MATAAYDFAPLDSALEARYRADEPGMAVLIAHGDTVLYERYIGLADMDKGDAVDADTRFCIASCSKQFTVMALLQQDALFNEPGGLLDTPAARWFPDYTAPFWRQVTLRHLASHTSGIPDSRPREDRDWCVHATDEQSVLYFPTVRETTFAPGEYYDYLNPSFILLARVVEQLSGEEFTDYMRRHVFGPAGMDATYYFAPASSPSHAAHGYVKENDLWREYDYGEETFYATRPDGGIYTTARDLLKWENALRDGIVADTGRVRLAYTPQVSVTASPYCDYQRRPDTWYGLGYFIDHPAGYPVKVYHTGDNGGFQAYLAKYPAEDLKIIVLETRNDHDRWQLATLIDRILRVRGD